MTDMSTKEAAISTKEREKFWTDQDRSVTEQRHIATIRRERKRGEGPPFVILGGLVRYPDTPYQQWLKDQLAKAGSLRTYNAHSGAQKDCSDRS